MGLVEGIYEGTKGRVVCVGVPVVHRRSGGYQQENEQERHCLQVASHR